MIQMVATKTPKANERPVTAKKEGIEKHLRHSLLFIRRLLDERKDGTVHYDESTKMNMMY